MLSKADSSSLLASSVSSSESSGQEELELSEVLPTSTFSMRPTIRREKSDPGPSQSEFSLRLVSMHLEKAFFVSPLRVP